MASSMLLFSTKRLALSSCLTMSTLMRARTVFLCEFATADSRVVFCQDKNTIYRCALACQTDRGIAVQFGNSGVWFQGLASAAWTGLGHQPGLSGSGRGSSILAGYQISRASNAADDPAGASR